MPGQVAVKLSAAALLLLVYYLAGRLGLSLAVVNVSATAIWAPTGIALASMLLWGYRVWPVILLGAFLVNITTSGSFVASLLIAVGNTLEGLVGAWLVNRYAHGRQAFERAADIVRFAVLAALFGTMVSATIGVSSLVLNGLADLAHFAPIWLTWWLGDATGALIMAPALLLWVENPTLGWSRRQATEALCLFALLLLFCASVFGGRSILSLQNYPLSFLSLPLVSWAALRFGQREVALFSLLLSALAVVGTLHGFGPFVRSDPNESLLLVQAFIAVVSMTGLILAAVVAERRRLERTLRESEESQRWLAAIVASSDDAVIGKSLDGTILSWNQAAEQIYGYTADEMIGQPILRLVPPERQDEMRHILDLIGRGERIRHHETERIRKDGTRVQVSLTISPIQDPTGIVLGSSAISRDITARQAAEQRIRYLAQHDALTGLPNRMLCLDRIHQAITRARRDQDKVAVLFLDLDGFKHINDSLGHEVGDGLLQLAARRLQQCVREGDSVARLGGDEFVICVSAIKQGADAMPITDKILRALREPFKVDRHELHVTGSIGISLYPTDGEDTSTLMRAADSAMYRAKEVGRDHYQFFTQQLNETVQRRVLIASRLHQALARGELTLHYLPHVDVRDGRIVAADALLRWQQPELGLVLPAEFIKVADETGLIVPIGEWMVRAACRQLQQWRETFHIDLAVAVKLTPQQLRRSDVAALIQRILQETALPASALGVDISESLFVTPGSPRAGQLEQLAAIGVRLVLDDFGTGHSSLGCLQRYPVHALKIDPAFIRGITINPSNEAIVEAIIALARSLQLQVIGAGVETPEQAAFLKAHGCLEVQGLYCREALPAEAFEALLRSHLTPADVKRNKNDGKGLML